MIALHQATHSDIDMIVDMRQQFGLELAGPQPAHLLQKSSELLKEYFNEELNKTCICWYASVDGVPVSIMVMVLRRQPGNIRNPSGRWGYLMNVFTLPHHRRKGLSTMLLEKITAHAKELGVTALELHATKDGEPVYIKNDFKLHPEPTYRKFI